MDKKLLAKELVLLAKELSDSSEGVKVSSKASGDLIDAINSIKYVLRILPKLRDRTMVEKDAEDLAERCQDSAMSAEMQLHEEQGE